MERNDTLIDLINNVQRDTHVTYDKNVQDYQKFNSRAKFDALKTCNKDCGFCYYKTRLNEQEEISLERMKELMSWLKSKEITSVEISGGEPLLYSYLTEWIEYTRSLGLDTSMVTNGSRPIVFKDAIDAGLQEVLFSLHGLNSHDQVVKRTGSLKALMRCWGMALGHGLKIRWNVVLEGDYVLDKDTREFLKLRILGGDQVNLLPLNNWSDNHSELSLEELKRVYKTIDNFTEDLRAVNLEIGQYNIRYPIWCLLDEKSRPFARGLYHHVIDKNDWNKYYYPDDQLSPRFINGEDIPSSPHLVQANNKGPNPYQDWFSSIHSPNVDAISQLEWNLGYPQMDPLHPDLNNKIKKERENPNQFYKDLKCIGCKFFVLCDGPRGKMTSKEFIEIQETAPRRKSNKKNIIEQQYQDGYFEEVSLDHIKNFKNWSPDE